MSSKPPAVAGPPNLAHTNGQAIAATTPAMTAVNGVGRMFTRWRRTSRSSRMMPLEAGSVERVLLVRPNV